MNRRGFLKGLAAVVGGVALEEAIPFGRVWSFPKQVKVARPTLTFDRIPANLKFHKDAFALISEPLEPSFYPLTQRIDVLYGFANLPPESFFQVEPEIAEMYRKGLIGNIAGFSYDDETSLPSAS